MVNRIISRISAEVYKNFSEMDEWFVVNEDLLNYNPVNGGWSIRKILEHISLTNHFLLILIRKGALKALKQSTNIDLPPLLIGYDLNWDKLAKIGEHQSFEWKRPEHMEPSGTADMTSIRNKLNQQLTDCVNCLNQLNKGEGILSTTMMTVNGLGKLDVYHYIYFLAQHAKRHLGQMNKVKGEFEKI